jgi:hypothetical protein
MSNQKFLRTPLSQVPVLPLTVGSTRKDIMLGVQAAGWCDA